MAVYGLGFDKIKAKKKVEIEANTNPADDKTTDTI
jgi:hypothetical protein